MRALIICYHCVKDEANSCLRPTKVADFEDQMQYLSREYNPVPLETVAQHIQNGTSLPPRAIAVTFDDGYRDNYENVYPIVKRYKIPATVFLTTGFVGTGELPAWERGHYTAEKPLMLSWKQVREMSDGGVSFGSHTLTHPFLTKVPRRQGLKEIHVSKDIIEQQIGKPVRTFAYPSGDFDSEVKGIVREAGYSAAVTTVAGCNGAYDDVCALRINIIQLQSFFHKLFPLFFRVEITGAVGHVRDCYHRMRRL